MWYYNNEMNVPVQEWESITRYYLCMMGHYGENYTCPSKWVSVEGSGEELKDDSWCLVMVFISGERENECVCVSTLFWDCIFPFGFELHS